MCMNVSSACMYLQCPRRSEDGVAEARGPELQVAGRELSGGWRQPNQGPPGERRLLLLPEASFQLLAEECGRGMTYRGMSKPTGGYTAGERILRNLQLPIFRGRLTA